MVNSQGPWIVIVTSNAERELKRLAPEVRDRVLKGIDRLHSGSTRDIKKLKNYPDTWRLRIGDWRIFFTVTFRERAIYILSVRHRREAYRN